MTKNKTQQEAFLKKQDKLNELHPERLKYGTNIRTCSEACAVFIKCPQYAESKGNLCKVVMDYQKEIQRKLKKIPNLYAQDLVMAEFAFGNLLKIREIENLITIEGFITKNEEGELSTHPLTKTLLDMQSSVKNFLMSTKTKIKVKKGKPKKQDQQEGNKWIPYSDILREASVTIKEEEKLTEENENGDIEKQS